MRTFLKNIDKNLMKKYMQEVMKVMDKSTVKFINNMYTDLLSQSDIDKELKLLLQYIFASIYNEDVPYSVFYATEEDIDGKWNDVKGTNFAYLENIKELWALYSKNGLRIKDKRLRELYNIRIYYNVKNKISYRDLSNIYDEVGRILNGYIEAEKYPFIDFINLLKDNDEVDAIKWACEEFLNINETDPQMFKSDRIILYSALLNYDSMNDTTLLSKIMEMSNIKNNFINSKNWKSYASLFRNLLDKFDKRLLHY